MKHKIINISTKTNKNDKFDKKRKEKDNGLVMRSLNYV